MAMKAFGLFTTVRFPSHQRVVPLVGAGISSGGAFGKIAKGIPQRI